MAVACLLGDGTPRASADPSEPKSGGSTLTFAERVAYQVAIENVYWQHRIWPTENPAPKPALEAVISRKDVEKKVSDYLQRSQALADQWQRPITAEQLQAEMERMAEQTQQPKVLRELFQALGDDPTVIAECLARPALAERLLFSSYAYDERIHGPLKERAQAELKAHPGFEQMKQLSGEYSEIELIKSDSAEPPGNGDPAHPGRTLNSSEWDDTLQKLAAMFSEPGAVLGSKSKTETRKNTAAEAYDAIVTERVCPLAEDEMRFYAMAVIGKTGDHLKVATVTWLKESLESWLAKAANPAPDAVGTSSVVYTLPRISNAADGCDDAWTPTAFQGTGRNRHTAVWTGSEMIVWGGEVGLNVFSNTGARYNPSTDSWAATSTVNAPGSRADHTAVWTGTEMIVWGGDTPGVYFDTGGRYNPGANVWAPTNTANAPHARQNQTAAWTGSEMIIWGGYFYDGSGHYVNTGGRYAPQADSWSATSIVNAPAGRDSHSVVWTGREMIVWGGAIANSQWVNTGGRYDPKMDSWTATSTGNAPPARAYHTAVWTGTEMIVWGGFTFSSQTNTGGRYNPSSDNWSATSITNAPTRRYDHTAVWTGSEMIVWGGYGCSDQSCQTTTYLNTGARYSPMANSWVATSILNAPARRASATSVWTGREMIIWGGYFRDGSDHYLNTGGRYCAEPSTPIVQSAMSRKTHGSAGSLDVNLPLSGTPAIECRSGGATGDYTLVVTFLANVSVSGTPQATVTSGSGAIGSGGVSNGGVVNTSSNVVTIPLTNVANAQTINVTLNNVNGVANVTSPMGVLVGDVDGNGVVNAADAVQTRNRSGQVTDGTNFRYDVDANGFINSGDAVIVRSFSGTALPPGSSSVVESASVESASLPIVSNQSAGSRFHALP